MKYLKRYNESVDFFPAISDDEAEKKLENLPLEQKINTIIRYKIYPENKIRKIINSIDIPELRNILRGNINIFNYNIPKIGS